MAALLGVPFQHVVMLLTPASAGRPPETAQARDRQPRQSRAPGLSMFMCKRPSRAGPPHPLLAKLPFALRHL